MTDPCVNTNMSAGAISPAAREIADIEAVSDVHVVSGEYNSVAQLKLEHSDDLFHISAPQMHDVAGLVDTTTNVAFEP